MKRLTVHWAPPGERLPVVFTLAMCVKCTQFAFLDIEDHPPIICPYCRGLVEEFDATEDDMTRFTVWGWERTDD